MAYILGMNTTIDFEHYQKDLEDGAEAQSIRTFLCCHLEATMSVGTIEELIRKGGLVKRAHLRYLTLDDLCDPSKGILQPQAVPRVTARSLLEHIPQFTASATMWKVKHSAQWTPPIYEDTTPVDHQGHAQGMIELNVDHQGHAQSMIDCLLSHDDLLFDKPVHESPMILNHDVMRANPSGTSPNVSRGAVSPPIARVDVAFADPDSLLSVWPGCSFCRRQDGTVKPYFITDRGPLMLCLSCYQTVRTCQAQVEVPVPQLSVCGNCTKEDTSVVLRRIGHDDNMMLCQTCFNLVARCRTPTQPSNFSSGSSSGGSVSTKSSCIQMHVDDLRGPSRSQGGSRGDPSTSSLVSALQKRMPSIPVKHGAVDTQGSQFLHYMDTIIQLARESADRGGDPEGGLYLAKVLKYIEQNPRIPLQDVPHLSRTRGAEGDSPDWIMYRVLQPGLRDIWADIPVDIKDSCSVIELFQFLSLSSHEMQRRN